MNVHEYQAKSLLKKEGIPVPEGKVAFSSSEARAAAELLQGNIWVVKAQIHAGGRGKGGGVRICHSPDEVETAARDILGRKLVTAQTGSDGKTVGCVLVEQGIDIARELYLSVVLDRSRGCYAVMASPHGGMDIESVAANSPESLFMEYPDSSGRLWPFQMRRLLRGWGLKGSLHSGAAMLIQKLVVFSLDHDAALAEINPLAVTTDDRLLVLDAKLNFDDSALKRHPDIAAMQGPDGDDILEQKARSLGISYVRLDGNVGTMVNGAGLAMATMDAVKQAGSAPANFLDVGGGANEKAVAAGFSVLLSDRNVRSVLINIFGGILRCDTVAQGIVSAVREAGAAIPLVIRMEGTNVGEGRRILTESGIPFVFAETMSEAARKAAELALEVRG